MGRERRRCAAPVEWCEWKLEKKGAWSTPAQITPFVGCFVKMLKIVVN
jgi:hypothetical protein